MPVNPNAKSLTESLSDGRILIELVNMLDENAIDIRTINAYEENMDIDKVIQNIVQGLTSAKGLIQMDGGISALGFTEQNPHVVLPLFNQIISQISKKKIDLKNVPQLKKLVSSENDETLAEMINMPANDTLLRWVNYKLKGANYDAVDNLGSDLGDGVVLSNLFNLLVETESPDVRSPISPSSDKERLD